VGSQPGSQGQHKQSLVELTRISASIQMLIFWLILSERFVYVNSKLPQFYTQCKNTEKNRFVEYATIEQVSVDTFETPRSMYFTLMHTVTIAKRLLTAIILEETCQPQSDRL
jgi:hypothetical protein